MARIDDAGRHNRSRQVACVGSRELREPLRMRRPRGRPLCELAQTQRHLEMLQPKRRRRDEPDRDRPIGSRPNVLDRLTGLDIKTEAQPHRSSTASSLERSGFVGAERAKTGRPNLTRESHVQVPHKIAGGRRPVQIFERVEDHRSQWPASTLCGLISEGVGVLLRRFRSRESSVEAPEHTIELR